MSTNRATQAEPATRLEALPDQTAPGASVSPTNPARAREFSTDLLIPHHAGMTGPWALAERARRNPDGALIARKSSVGGRWRDMPARSFRAHVRQVAAGLVALGLAPGERVSIMAHTCYEWTLLDFAAWEAGLVVVPVYETSSAEQAEWILTDAGVRLVIAETDVMATMLRTLAATVPALEGLIVLSLEADAVTELVTAGTSAGVSGADLDARAGALTSADLATIVYTSGTTGRPKGAELTHANLVHLAVNTVAYVPEVLAGDDVRTLIFLPLAHVLARFVEIAIVCSDAGVMGHAPSVTNLVTDLASFQPTFVIAVPRVFEKIYNAADARAAGTRQKVFRLAAKTAIAYSRALDTPAGPSRALRAQRAAFDRLVFSTLRSLLGGRVTHVISGGGPLGERLGHFYRGAGVTVLEGYGLTETAAPCTVNLPTATSIGSVGLPLPGSAVRVDEDGEVLVRGIGVFRGYHGNPEATQAAFVQAAGERWLRTGDVGSFDERGFLRITGRKKELIVTAGGKNVAPAPLEDRLRAHPLISQVLVVGEGRPCIGALLTLDAEMVPLWLASHAVSDVDPTDLAAVAAHPRVHEALERAVARTNRAVSRAESIRVFSVLPGDLTVSNGLLTPSLKVRRAEACQRFAAQIDALYQR